MRSEWQGDREVWLADSVEEIESAGWTILMYEDWKPGVARARCVKGGFMREVFVKSEACDGTGALVV
jgi:hypothetical protein